ncbi:MAG: antibiotic ABC transporter ATP-binding protein [Bacteroidetes bacterium]|nr:MAG: antibiotic ABC transporter ATP-binding protein [Bacteroidota bacterium]
MKGKPKSVSGKAFDVPLLKRVVKYAIPYKRAFILGFFLTIVLAFMSITRPILILYTFDNYINVSDLEGLRNITILMIGLLLIESVLQFYNTYLTNWLGQSVIRDLRLKVYKHILRFKLTYFDNTAIGTLVTRSISDIETIAEVFSQGLLVIMGDLLQLSIVIIAMFVINWQLALVSLASIPFLIFTTVLFKQALKAAFRDVRTQVSRLNAFVQEHITGMSIVQIFNREDVELQRFNNINEVHKQAHLRTVWIFSIFFPIIEILAAISLGLLVWWGMTGVYDGDISKGEIIAFIFFINMLFRPIRQLADRFNTLQMGMVGAERVFKILDTDSVIENKGTIGTKNIKGSIVFDKVWFAYKDEDWVLKDVSFEVKEGETIAIVGATGAGKTSIINLLGRFYSINKGRILIDGIETQDYSLEALRGSTAVVLQDVFLFSDSIFNNITLNDESINLETVQEAAKIVGVHDFIMSLPGGYDYNVQERGAVLSVGQRQLIAFLRAYVSNPKILVLDEATSSVDTETEQLIQHAIQQLTANRTSIVIAHRLATIQASDMIIVMHHGEIKESGTHNALLEINGQYKKLYDLSLIEN